MRRVVNSMDIIILWAYVPHSTKRPRCHVSWQVPNTSVCVHMPLDWPEAWTLKVKVWAGSNNNNIAARWDLNNNNLLNGWAHLPINYVFVHRLIQFQEADDHQLWSSLERVSSSPPARKSFLMIDEKTGSLSSLRHFLSQSSHFCCLAEMSIR